MTNLTVEQAKALRAVVADMEALDREADRALESLGDMYDDFGGAEADYAEVELDDDASESLEEALADVADAVFVAQSLLESLDAALRTVKKQQERAVAAATKCGYERNEVDALSVRMEADLLAGVIFSLTEALDRLGEADVPPGHVAYLSKGNLTTAARRLCAVGESALNAYRARRASECHAQSVQVSK